MQICRLLHVKGPPAGAKPLNKIRSRRNLSSDYQKTLEKIHAKRTCHSSHHEKGVKTRTKSSSRFVPSAISYRILENSRTKRPSQKLCEAEICKKLEKLHKKPATDQRAQNATPVEETPCNHSMSAPPERYAGAQNATPVEETLCNRSKSAQKTIPVNETAPGRPECGGL